MSDEIVDVDLDPEEGTPYRPPESEVAEASAVAGLPWTLPQIGVGTFLSGPFVGLWMHASNLGTFGEPGKVGPMRLLAVGATVVVLAVAFVLPDGFPSSVLPMAYTVAVVQVAKQAHGERLAALKAAGGPSRSWVAAIVFGAVGLVANVALFFGVAWLTGPGEYTHAGLGLTYSEGATEEDAAALVEALRDIGYPVDSVEGSIDLTTDDGTLDVCFVVQSGTWSDPEMTEVFTGIDAELEARLARPIAVHLCDWMSERRWSAP